MAESPRSSGDPPEILAIKRAFGKLPPKLTYQDGVIRFKYLRPIDILPGAALITIILVVGIKLLVQGAIEGGLSATGVLALSILLGPIYLFLQWLLPRWGATAILTKEGIGLERNGKLVQFHKWIQINKMSIGRNSNSPITFWSSTEILGCIPSLLTVYSFTGIGYHDLQGAILTTFSKESAPFIIDMANDHKLASQNKWIRPLKMLSVSIAAAVLSFIIGPFLFRFSELFAYLTILTAAPWILIGVVAFLLSIMDISRMREERQYEPSGQVLSVGNSNLQFDLQDRVLLIADSRISYASLENRISSAWVTVALVCFCTLAITVTLSIVFLTSAPLIIKIIASLILLGSYTIIFIPVRLEFLTRKSSAKHLIFDEDAAYVKSNGQQQLIESFGNKQISYEEFKRNPRLFFGFLRVNLKDQSLYFLPSAMVSLSDQEIMNYLPDELTKL